MHLPGRHPKVEYTWGHVSLTNRLVGRQEQWLQCSAVRQLQKNLGQERSAVFTFYYTFCDEVRAWRSLAHIGNT